MRGRGSGALSVGVAAISLVACPRVEPYRCSADEQCVHEGRPGRCELDVQQCAYPDDGCPSGWRYSDAGPRGEAACVAREDDTLGGTSTTTDGVSTLASTGADSSATTAQMETDTEAAGGTSGGACVLEPSSPLSFEGEDDLVVHQRFIEATSSRGIRVVASPGVVVSDVEVHFSGNAGIVIQDSPGAVIERVKLVNVGPLVGGSAAPGEVGLHVERCDGATIRDVLVVDPRTGIQVLDSDDIVIEDVVVQNARGDPDEVSDEGGDCVLVQESQRVDIRRFGCSNEPVGDLGHSGIFVDRCTSVLVEDGVASNFPMGGIRVHTYDAHRDVLVRHVDVVGGRHACYDTVGGDEVTYLDTGCRNNPDWGWVGHDQTGPVRVQQGRYYNLGRGTHCCDDVFAEFDAHEDQFVPLLPPDVAAPCSM